MVFSSLKMGPGRAKEKSLFRLENFSCAHELRETVIAPFLDMSKARLDKACSTLG